ncbi:hypothetical protein [Microbispora sp. GKU 823]|uniref:hypothetical protein n=1 Tax=Microbispora sp. GKU 823 TaxID=1652100 RepID=UPI0009A431EE|nr:hypothetical protein [Microbispora sp. GKU 823]OPG11531.1 hypothetical protein B1L11_19790 [Microbispora sp. GKU 823]
MTAPTPPAPRAPGTVTTPAQPARRAPGTAATAWIDENAPVLTGLADRIWAYAEPSLREWRSALATAELLRSHGFTISWGTAGLPAAFVATSGDSGPVLGFNVEYDALPGLSQRAGVPRHEPTVFEGDEYAPAYGHGHGCGHNALAAASTGAAIAAARALRGRATIRVFASTGEEQLVGKAYAVRDGAYDGLDAFLDWHPAPVTGTGWEVTSALYSATFSFLGSPGHGSNPLGTRSGLDGVLLLTGMIERLRAGNVSPSGRIGYAIGGGGAPNVTPDLQTLWVYVREATHERARTLYDKVVACAAAAAVASQTRLEHRLVTAIREGLGNRAGAELLHHTMSELGPPAFTDADHEFAVRLQEAIGRPGAGLATVVLPLRPPAEPDLGGPSSDTSEVSWTAPHLSLTAAVVPIGVPLHSWAATASTGTAIAHAGLLAAARYLASAAVTLVEQPETLAAVRQEFAARERGPRRCPRRRSRPTTCRRPRSSKRRGSRHARSGRRPFPPNS